MIQRGSELATTLDRALRLKQIEAVLPGIYARTHHKSSPEVRVEALQLYEPKAILVEHAAARLSFWPEAEVDDVAAVVPRKLAARPGYRFLRRRVPASLVQEIDGVRMTVPALTAVDLGADAIDRRLADWCCHLGGDASGARRDSAAAGKRRAAALVQESVERRALVDSPSAGIHRLRRSGRHRRSARETSKALAGTTAHRRRLALRRSVWWPRSTGRSPSTVDAELRSSTAGAQEPDRPRRLRARPRFDLDHDPQVPRAGGRGTDRAALLSG